jgi:predicted amidohydrolase YtcJ
VAYLDPLLGLHAAVIRKHINGQSVNKTNAWGSWKPYEPKTWNGAFASFENNSKGSIVVG